MIEKKQYPRFVLCLNEPHGIEDLTNFEVFDTVIKKPHLLQTIERFV